MILMIGPMVDSGTANLALLLMGRREKFLVLDPRNLGERWDIHWHLDGEGTTGCIQTLNRRVPLEKVKAIWAHMVMMPDRADEEAPGGTGIPQERFNGLIAFVDSFPGTVINRPSVASSNSIKPYQARIISEAGFPFIRTLVTTSPEEARGFYEECSGQAIFKSISWRRSIVRRMTDEDVARLDHVQYCPTQFQEFIPGSDVRVHVVGDRLFATEITANVDDYRYVPLEGERLMRAVRLPEDIDLKCRRLAHKLDMEICGIDLRRTPDERYYCFEANPIPGYLFYERYTGQRIGDAIADLLCACKGLPAQAGSAL